jgi:hypothetical protein
MGLGARRTAVELDDVAEFAGERTAARELNADIEILLELEQVEARDRGLGDIDLELDRLERALAVAALQATMKSRIMSSASPSTRKFAVS